MARNRVKSKGEEMNWKRKGIKYVCLNVNIPCHTMKKIEEIIDKSDDLNLTKSVLINAAIEEYLQKLQK